MGYAHGPGQKIFPPHYSAAAQCINDAQKSFLEKIFCKELVFNQEMNTAEQFILIAFNKRFKRIAIAFLEMKNQLGIC
jgi:hypothetical protein